MEQFAKVTKTDFNFPIPISKLIILQAIGIHDEEYDWKQGQLEDRSLGEVNVPLLSKWIKQQVSEGELPPVGLTDHLNLEWNAIRIQEKEQKPDRIKNVVNPLIMKKWKLHQRKLSIKGRP